MPTAAVAAAAALVLVMVGVTATSAELFDLSYTFNENAPTSPKFSAFRQELQRSGRNKLGIWVEVHSFCSSEHSGTHINAPRHHYETGWAVNDIPNARLWRVPGVVVDVSKRISQSRNKNYEVTVRDLEAWEREHGVIPDRALVFIHTGWGKMVNNSGAYTGVDPLNNLNFPGVGKGAAEWLVKHGSDHGHDTGVVGVGIDTLSLDKGVSVRFPAQVKLFQSNIYGVENVANLDKLPESGFYVTVMPMKIGGGSGAPARVIAEVDEGPGPNNASPTPSTLLLPPLLTATVATFYWFLEA